jgi:hypothetical protein
MWRKGTLFNYMQETPRVTTASLQGGDGEVDWKAIVRY